MPNVQRFKRLDVLQAEVTGCTRCGLAATRTHTVFDRGTAAFPLVAFVGEGPGENEDREGVPFVGQAGRLLDKLIVEMGLRPEEVYVCNVVKCRPPGNRKPEPGEIAACQPYLVEQLVLVQPRVIVALGATAVRGLLGKTDGITKVRGQWKLYGETPVMPTFHPAYLLRVSEAIPRVRDDLYRVMVKLGMRTMP